jgi:hypothetical protein
MQAFVTCKNLKVDSIYLKYKLNIRINVFLFLHPLKINLFIKSQFVNLLKFIFIFRTKSNRDGDKRDRGRDKFTDDRKSTNRKFVLIFVLILRDYLKIL